MLAVATGESADGSRGCPIGERDRRLLDVRTSTFGPRLDCEATCPDCGERLELSLDGAGIRDSSRAAASDDGTPGSISAGGWHVTFRLPDSADVVAAGEAETEREGSGGDRLFERCVTAARSGGQPAAPHDVPADVRDIVAARMAELDPGADLSLDLACPACDRRWSAPFDPAGFLLEEIDAYALRLLADVDVLARAYGWREPDVLALGPLRRRRYLELAAG